MRVYQLSFHLTLGSGDGTQVRRGVLPPLGHLLSLHGIFKGTLLVFAASELFCCWLVWFGFWGQGLAIYSRLALNLLSSYLSFMSSEIIGMYHCASCKLVLKLAFIHWLLFICIV